MKKFKMLLIGIMIIVATMFTGCGDDNYIETTKNITFDTGVSVEEIITGYVNAGEFYKLNYNQIKANQTQLLGMFYMTSEGAYNTAKIIGIKLPKKSTIKWEVAGKTETGKIITAYNENVEISIQTQEDGDYISLYLNDIKPKMKDKKYYLNKDQFEAYKVLYDVLLEEDNK